MVALVIIALEDATTVIGGAEIIYDFRIFEGAFFGQIIENIEVTMFTHINLDSGEGALFLNGAV